MLTGFRHFLNPYCRLGPDAAGTEFLLGCLPSCACGSRGVQVRLGEGRGRGAAVATPPQGKVFATLVRKCEDRLVVLYGYPNGPYVSGQSGVELFAGVYMIRTQLQLFRGVSG